MVYIAGPYRPTATCTVESGSGKSPPASTKQSGEIVDENQIGQNIVRAHNAGRAVVAAGGMPITPHKLTEHFDGLIPDEEFIARDLGTYLPLCDAVWAIEGWHESRGAREEVLHALDRAMMVVETEQEMRDWVAFCLDQEMQRLPAWATRERAQRIGQRARGGGA